MGKSSPTKAQKKKERRHGRSERAIAASLAQHISSIAKANRKANARRELALLRSTAELRFVGDVIIDQSRDDAIAAASKACRPSPKCTEEELIFYVDGSSFHQRGKHNARRCAGAAVVFQADGGQGWQERVFPLPSDSDASTAEMIAISEGLAVALSQTLIQPASGIRKVVIFSDCQEALSCLSGLRQHTFSEGWLRDDLNSVLRKLITRSQYFGKLGISVELRWVPAHSGVEGNMRADAAARSAAADDSAGRGFAKGVYLDEALRLIEDEVIGKHTVDEPVRRKRQRSSRYLPEGHLQLSPEGGSPTHSTPGSSSSCVNAPSPEPVGEMPRSTKPVYGLQEVTSRETGENTNRLSCCPGGTGSDAASICHEPFLLSAGKTEQNAEKNGKNPTPKSTNHRVRTNRTPLCPLTGPSTRGVTTGEAQGGSYL